MEYESRQVRDECNWLVRRIKDYNSWLPLAGGIFAGGATTAAGWIIGGVSNLYPSLEYFTKTGDLLSTLQYFYTRVSSVAGQYFLPGYAVGHLLTYGIEKGIAKIWRWIWGK